MDQVPTLIFDEKDSGFGGRCFSSWPANWLRSQETPKPLREPTPAVAAYRTVIAVLKNEENRRPVTTIRRLDQAERLAELCRMLAGKISAATKALAADFCGESSDYIRSVQDLPPVYRLMRYRCIAV